MTDDELRAIETALWESQIAEHRARTRAGIALARARGVKLGRPRRNPEKPRPLPIHLQRLLDNLDTTNPQ